MLFRPGRLACTSTACRTDPCCNTCRGEWQSEGIGLKLEGEGVPAALTDSCGKREFDIRATGRREGARFLADSWHKVAPGLPHQIGTSLNGPKVARLPTVALGSLRIVDGDRSFELLPVEKLIKIRLRAMGSCLARVLRDAPKTKLSDLTLRFRIEPRGNVTQPQAKGNPDPEIQSCVENTARRLRFPDPPAEPITVEAALHIDRGELVGLGTLGF